MWEGVLVDVWMYVYVILVIIFSDDYFEVDECDW